MSVAMAGGRSCRTPGHGVRAEAHEPAPRARPAAVDAAGLRPGAAGSCTGNAIAGAMEYERDRQGLSDFIPSRLFVYYNERALEGTVSSDSGAVSGTASRSSTPKASARRHCGPTTSGCSR